VLGVNLSLLAGLSALSIWGLRTGERRTDYMRRRFEISQMVQTLTAETSALGQNSGRMIVGKKVTDEIVGQIMESRKTGCERCLILRRLRPHRRAFSRRRV